MLVFLEAQALLRPLPNYALHLAEDLLAAARTLGLRSLEVGCRMHSAKTECCVDQEPQQGHVAPATHHAVAGLVTLSRKLGRQKLQRRQPMRAAVCAPQEVCEAKLGQSRERLRLYSFEEVQAANAAGNCWLILDGKPSRRFASKPQPWHVSHFISGAQCRVYLAADSSCLCWCRHDSRRNKVVAGTSWRLVTFPAISRFLFVSNRFFPK